MQLLQCSGKIRILLYGERTDLKTKYKVILIVSIIVLIILVVIIYSIGIPRIKGHLYGGDHITINLTVKLDGAPISLEGLNATCIYDNKTDNTVNSLDGTYKTQGGKYGSYSFEVTIPKDRLNDFDNDMIIKLNFLNANNWYISQSNCAIDLYASKNIISGSSNVIVKYSDGTSNEYNQEVELNNNAININWGL